jgi:hypothetical protein
LRDLFVVVVSSSFASFRKLPYASLRSRLGKAVDKGRFDAMALSRRYWPQRIERTGLTYRDASPCSHLSESRRQPHRATKSDDDDGQPYASLRSRLVKGVKEHRRKYLITQSPRPTLAKQGRHIVISEPGQRLFTLNSGLLMVTEREKV